MCHPTRLPGVRATATRLPAPPRRGLMDRAGRLARWLPMILTAVSACGDQLPTPPVVQRPLATIAADPGSTLIARDGFERTSSAGWGSADIGGRWLYNSEALDELQVDGSQGLVVVPTIAPRVLLLEDVLATSSRGMVSFTIAQVPDNPDRFHTVELYTRRRSTAAGEYYYRYRVRAFGTGEMDAEVERSIAGVPHSMASRVTLPVRWEPAARYWIRWDAVGTSPSTVIRMKVWRDGTSEPAGWQLTSIVDEPQLDLDGTVGIRVSPPSADQSALPLTYAFGNLTVAAPPANNAAPEARIVVPPFATANTALLFDGRGSADPDGDAALAFHWEFGDGSTGSGATPRHTYIMPGTYTVRLTVIDSHGVASTPATATLDVAAGEGQVLVGDSFTRLDPGGWGVADIGGRWRPSSVTPGLFTTDGGRGVITAQPGSTHNIIASEGYAVNVGGLVSFTVDVAPSLDGRFHTVQTYARRDDRVNDGDDYYRFRVRLFGSGGMDVRIEKSVGTAQSWVTDNTGLPFEWLPGQRLWMRWQAVGTSPATVVAMRVWPDGIPEPVDWQVSAVVDEPRLDVIGTTGVRVQAPRESPGPVGFAFDDLVYRLMQ